MFVLRDQAHSDRLIAINNGYFLKPDQYVGYLQILSFHSKDYDSIRKIKININFKQLRIQSTSYNFSFKIFTQHFCVRVPTISNTHNTKKNTRPIQIEMLMLCVHVCIAQELNHFTKLIVIYIGFTCFH